MKQEFIDYELHLQMYNDALWRGGMAYARHEVGEPIKPEGYDEYKASQNTDNQVVVNELKDKKDSGFSYIDFINRLEIAEKELNTEKGLFYDEDGIPQYLSADDHYNGIENPEWLKKHTKTKKETETKPQIQKEASNLQDKIKYGGWHNYDEDGVPEYLSYADRYDGIVNPEWLKKHGNKN
jgi:hypothetical protein